MSSKKDGLRPEYSADLIKSGVRGKYAKRYREEGNKALRDYAAQRKRSAT